MSINIISCIHLFYSPGSDFIYLCLTNIILVLFIFVILFNIHVHVYIFVHDSFIVLCLCPFIYFDFLYTVIYMDICISFFNIIVM